MKKYIYMIFTLFICIIGINSVKADYYKEYKACDINSEGNYVIPTSDGKKLAIFKKVGHTDISAKYEIDSSEKAIVDGAYGVKCKITRNPSSSYHHELPVNFLVRQVYRDYEGDLGWVYEVLVYDRERKEDIKYISGEYYFEIHTEGYKVPWDNNSLLKEFYTTCKVNHCNTNIEWYRVNNINEAVCYKNGKEVNISEVIDNSRAYYEMENAEWRLGNYLDCNEWAKNGNILNINDKFGFDEYEENVENNELIYDPSSIVISNDSVKLAKYLGQTTYNVAENKTAIGKYDTNVAYESSTPSCVSIDQNGLATAVGTSDCDSIITVKSPYNDIVKNTMTISVITKKEEQQSEQDNSSQTGCATSKGATIQITYGERYKFGKEYEIMSGSDYIEKDGTDIKAKKVGEGGIQVKNGNECIIYPVSVKKKNVVHDELILLEVGKTKSFSDINSIGGLTWSSDDTNIATVDNKSGKITAKSSGTTKITASNENYSYSVNVYVSGNKEKVEISPEVNEGTGYIVNIGDGKNGYTWSSSDNNVATVDNNGNVTLKKEGSAVIIGKSSNGEYYVREFNVLKKQTATSDNGTTSDSYASESVITSKAEYRIDDIIDPKSDAYKMIKSKFKKVNKMKIYDIGYYLNDKKVQPSGEVIISLDIPTDYDAKKLSAFRVEDNGELTLLPSRVEGNNIKITTTHFSYYILAEVDTDEAVQIVKEANKELVNVTTGNIITAIIVVCSSLLVLAIGYITIKKNKLIRL